MLTRPEDRGFRVPSQVGFLLLGSVAGKTASGEDRLNVLEKIDRARGGWRQRSSVSCGQAQRADKQQARDEQRPEARCQSEAGTCRSAKRIHHGAPGRGHRSEVTGEPGAVITRTFHNEYYSNLSCQDF